MLGARRCRTIGSQIIHISDRSGGSHVLAFARDWIVNQLLMRETFVPSLRCGKAVESIDEIAEGNISVDCPIVLIEHQHGGEWSTGKSGSVSVFDRARLEREPGLKLCIGDCVQCRPSSSCYWKTTSFISRIFATFGSGITEPSSPSFFERIVAACCWDGKWWVLAQRLAICRDCWADFVGSRRWM
jgi:hypothetical protein